MDYYDSPGEFSSLLCLPRSSISPLVRVVQSWTSATLITVVVRSECRLLNGLISLPGMGRRARRTRHERLKIAGNIYHRVLHEAVYQVCLLADRHNDGAWIGTVEVAEPASQTFLESSVDLCHMHILSKVPTHTADQVKSYGSHLDVRLGHLGYVHTLRAGTHLKSGMHIVDYFSKSDTRADDLFRGAFPTAQSRLLYRGPHMPWCKQATLIRAASWDFSFKMLNLGYTPFVRQIYRIAV